MFRCCFSLSAVAAVVKSKLATKQVIKAKMIDFALDDIRDPLLGFG